MVSTEVPRVSFFEQTMEGMFVDGVDTVRERGNEQVESQAKPVRQLDDRSAPGKNGSLALVVE